MAHSAIQARKVPPWMAVLIQGVGGRLSRGEWAARADRKRSVRSVQSVEGVVTAVVCRAREMAARPPRDHNRAIGAGLGSK